MFVKYGMMTDDKFLDKANKFHIMHDAREAKFYTLEEYRLAAETLQKNKDGKLVILYTTDPGAAGCLHTTGCCKGIHCSEAGNDHRQWVH